MINLLPKAGRVSVHAKSPMSLKWHQCEAIKALDARVQVQPRFAGLLVMPTGSGKTITAANWLLKNVINRRKKLLWIAHRHELLVQALQTFISNASNDLVPNRDSFRYRIISGLPDHDIPFNISPDDDLIIASKDSLQQRGLDYLLRQWIKGDDEIFLVIDEAHHATAKTYRFIIESLAQRVSKLKILGLTATPIRTSEQERGLLKKVFPDDIVYKIDLKTLIARGILAEPRFRDTLTHYEISKEISARDLGYIRRFDLPTDIATKLATHKERNHLIVSEYFKGPSPNERYGQTLIFALNIDHAIALSGVFNEWGKDKGIKSAFVVSGLQDSYTGVNLSREQNQKNIEDFRSGRVQVLVNVLILTEGVDLPQAETVFLTRPTISEILMTQMIGRVLRGPEMGGTRKAYVVSFIDDWQDKISWVSPEFLYDFEADFPADSYEATQRMIRLISVAKIQEFARLLDQSVDTEDIQRLPAIDRVPLGLYSFTLQDEKHCVVLVYSHHKQAYEAMLQDLPQLFKEADLDKNLTLSPAEIERILPIIKRCYFEGCHSLLAYRDEDLADILLYFGEKGAAPAYLEFKDREKYDISKVAAEILQWKLDPFAERDYINQLWVDTTTFWNVYYGNNKKYFLHDLYLEKNRLLYGDQPDVIQSSQQIIDLSSPGSPDIPRAEVLARDNNRCLCCGEEVNYLLQVDHIIPRARGGEDVFSNLQTLCRVCNGSKSDEFIINFREHTSPLGTPSLTFREFPLPWQDKVHDNRAWEKYLRRSINFFYQCAAVKSVIFKPDSWQIELHLGNDPAWLNPDLEAGLKIIRERQKAGGIEALSKIEIIAPNRLAATCSLVAPVDSGRKMISKKLKYLPDGTLCRFSYKYQRFEGKISNGRLVIAGKGSFTTFSAASDALTRTSRNGWKDWELQLPGTSRWFFADDWRKDGAGPSRHLPT